MKVFVSAAEISSDLQAEKILRAMIELSPLNSVQIAGIGGPKLRALPGFHCIQEAESLRAMGFIEVLSKIKSIRQALERARKYLDANPPDLILTFDYPDFHLRLLKSIEQNPKLKHSFRVCGIPPKVWVWRAKRLQKIKRLYQAVWVIFPFEKKLYERNGIPVIYSGNPLIASLFPKDKVPSREIESEKDPEWRDRSELRIAVLPGSRDAELKHHLPVIPDTLEELARLTSKRIVAEVPVPNGIALETVSQHLRSSNQVSYHFSRGDSSEVLRRNHLGLIKSGTASLEAAVLGCVPVIFYRVSTSTALIFKFLIRYLGPVGLPNILLGIKERKHALYPELLASEATPGLLAEALFRLLKDQKRMQTLREQGESLSRELVPEMDVAKSAASQILNWVSHPPPAAIPRVRRMDYRFISFLWSSLNRFRRSLYQSKILKQKNLSVPSVLVGNLQAGGSGKTPVVIEVARRALAEGYRVGIVSRGYKATLRVDGKRQKFIISQPRTHYLYSADQIGDEPKEISLALPDVYLGMGADRVQIAETLQALGVNFLVFDDGFQNLKFKAEISVLLVTDARPDEIIYRDFSRVSATADLVLQTKGAGDARWPDRTVRLNWVAENKPSQKIWLYCALGDPAEVKHFYETAGLDIAQFISKADHSLLNEDALQRLIKEASLAGAVLAMTPKDAIKVDTAKFPTIVILKRKILNTDWLEVIFKR